MTRHWLMKTEPSTFGIDHLEKVSRKTTMWDGVRNYQARNMLRDDMRRGDLASLYHSSCDEPGIVGTVQIVREAYPDPSAFQRGDHHYDPDSDPKNPRWFVVDVKLKQRFSRAISLDELRAHGNGALRGMLLLRKGNRLSITPVDPQHWKFILDLQ